MRLIDAESPQNGIYVSDLVIEEMKKIPTVDIDRPTRSQFKRMAVQLGYEKIVHCRECRKMKTYECPMHSANSYDDFCSFGERRKDGNEDRA